jgi:hypothetical protein
MSFDVAMLRVAQLQSLLAPTQAAPAAPAATTTTAGPNAFASMLQNAGGAATIATAPPATGTAAGQAVLNAVRGEVGVAESPPGSNNSPRIAEYRQATAGSGVKPQPGDLIVWDEHIGVVESVDASGTINTIEGNSSDQVSRRTYAPGARDAIGYVRLG